MTPEERRAYEEKREKQNLANWEITCQEMSVADLREVIETLEKGIEQSRLRLRTEGPDPRTQRDAYDRALRRIRYYEQQCYIARREWEAKLKASNQQ